MVIKEIQEEVDWLDYMDAEATKTMLKEEGEIGRASCRERV